jgi:hypothetical protein
MTYPTYFYVGPFLKHEIAARLDDLKEAEKDLAAAKQRVKEANRAYTDALRLAMEECEKEAKE